MAPAKIGAGMFAAESYTSRHYVAIVAMACLCVLLGGPSYAAGAESLIIAGTTYCEPGVSGLGWAWTDADHLELNGYTGEAIGADDDLVVTLTGQNTVVETSAPDVDISRCGMEVWGDLTLRGSGSLVATRLVAPAGGAFGAGGVVDADGSVAARVTIEPVDATASAGETGGPDVPGDGPSVPGADSATGEPAAGPSTNPKLKPAAATTRTTATTVTKATVTNTTVSKSSKPNAAAATTATLPKTGDSHWIALSAVLFLLGTALARAGLCCVAIGEGTAHCLSSGVKICSPPSIEDVDPVRSRQIAVSRRR